MVSRAVCLDPVAGASGDMILAALIDLGADPGEIVRALRAAGLGEVDIRFERRACRQQIVCGYVEVLDGGAVADGAPAATAHAHPHPHDHGHDHPHPHEHNHKHADDHGHAHAHEPGHAHPHKPAPGAAAAPAHHHRGLREILALIERVPAPARARERAARIFRRLGEAEAAVHGVAVEAVHFHEVGAVDSIADIVGICLALEQLGVERVFSAPLKVGQGTIRCAHGVLPNPAPATARLLEGCEVVCLPLAMELTTPTGAAVISALSEGPWDSLPMRVLRTGTGHGRRDLEALPNILRAFLVDLAPQSAGRDAVTVIECDIDDQTPEVTGALLEDLLAAGALDVSISPVQMKKNRPGSRLTVLAAPAEASRLGAFILEHSSTIGVRTWPAERMVLKRAAASADTPWGAVVCKRIERPDGVELTPEFESARRLASACGVPLRHVLDAARRWEPKAP